MVDPGAEVDLTPQVEGHAQTGAQRSGDLIDLDESDGQVEGQRMRVSGDPQAPMTGTAGGVGDLPYQVAGDTTTAPVRIDEEVLELGTVVLVSGQGREPDDPVVAWWAGHRDQSSTGGNAVPGED